MHSFQTLLRNLATIIRNTCQSRDADAGTPSFIMDTQWFVVVFCLQVRHLCATGNKKGLTISREPLYYMAGAAGIEPAVPESKSGALTAWPRPNFNYFNSSFTGD